MRRPTAIPNYDRQLAEYRRIRAQLADYIALLTLSFRDSGLTIHEILGKSIGSSPYLEGVPAEVLEQVDISDAFTNVAGIAQLKAVAAAVEKAALGAASAAAYWKSTGLTHAERFTVEEVSNLALRASRAYRAVAALRDDLPAHHIDRATDDAVLASLGHSLDAVLTLPDVANEQLLIGLLQEGIAPKLVAFIGQCERHAAAERQLAQVLAAELDHDTLSSVERVAALCETAALDTLEWAALQTQLREHREALKKARDIASAMAPLVQARPEAAQWSFASVAKAHAAIAEAGYEALSRRNSASADPAAVAVLKSLCAEGRALQEKKAELKTQVSLSVDAPVEVLVRTIAALRAAGIFSLLSGEYRQAKRLARALSLAERFEKRDALERLEALASYRRKEREFVQNPQAAALFGLHFRGVDTDFGPFERLAHFYEGSQSTLAGVEGRALRNFLRDADMEELELVPPVPADVSVDSLESLQRQLVLREEEIGKLDGVLEALRPLLGIFRDPSAVRPDTLSDLAERLRTVLAERRALEGYRMVAALLGERFQGTRTATAELKPACAWAQRSAPVARQVASVLNGARPAEAAAQIRRVLEAQANAAKLLTALCELARMDVAHFTDGRDDAGLAAFLECAAADQDGLFRHAALATALSELQGTGTTPLVEYRMKAGVPQGLAAQFEALVVRKLAKAAYAEYGERLARYPGSRLDELRSDLARQDREIIRLARQQLRWKIHADAKPPYGNGIGKKSTWTQMALIENEVSKQQRFISVRDLTQRAGRALLELKPCWMMSPLAVAQYVSKDAITFDLCIIDEASQMPPEEAIGALLRCRQTVVVGDTNQLPPSSFFKKMIDDEDADEDEAVLNESILEMANATFRPARRLRWHYRSRHSGLIKFSNRLVYDDNLIVFPSAAESMARMGVEFQAVDGLYKAGTNAVEARAIVDAALQFMRTDPGRSLGIVTLNQKQRDLIREEFEYALDRNRHALAYVEEWKEKNDGLEEFFIKNLENVQGDERDVIFIGTVYGPETKGARVAQRFGPINGLAGKRRLNVLFSRAKEKIVTFSSMTAADIVAEETGNAGAHMLKRWLEYCASGLLDGGIDTAREPDSEFEVFVMGQIRAMGYEPVPQVGAAGYFIDIGVRHPGWPHGFVLGVECDGANYHSAKSARDRDRLRQEVLESLGWRFHRIWSTDWFNNPRREAERLRNVLSARMEELKARQMEFVVRTARPDPASIVDLPKAVPEPGPSLTARAGQSVVSVSAPKPLNDRVVAIGDTVRVRYLNADGKVLQLTISKEKSDVRHGVVHFEAPIAKALLGAEQGDEVEVLTGSYVHSAVVESIVKAGREASASP